MTGPIAIVGLACRFPDASSPQALWENTLAGRRAFRRMPPERLRLEDYFSADRANADGIYITEAALLEGYEFDRLRFRVAGSAYRAADLTHWLALDVAAQALADAGFPDAHGLPRERCGVLVGNSLNGEFSRAASLRLRWPYVRRVTESALAAQGWNAERRAAFLADLEIQFKSPFPVPGDETLAGGLANVIAGRICNHFDLKGGGYTVDGACSSSLLAVAHGCTALTAGDLDVALVGGVDLSLDPFELVGFARAGALAAKEMRVFDAQSAGFWPGEGCGFALLMRQADALAHGLRVHATICGWGVSSDGSGGLTRPEVSGQLLALGRAYERAGFGIETVRLFEGHGTGTAVGDRTELQALSAARRAKDPGAAPAAIGSVKSLIGHTKAAAGMAGLIKATMALSRQILPPSSGFDTPHPELAGEQPALQLLADAQPWPADAPLRAGVSAMGFGGINVHIALGGVATERRSALDAGDRLLVASAQDAELLLLGAGDRAALLQQVDQLCAIAPGLSRAELADLSAHLAVTLAGRHVRAAVVASSPAELADGLAKLRLWLATGERNRVDAAAGVFLGSGDSTPRIAFLFPGQGAPAHRSGGALRRRFDFLQPLYARPPLPSADDALDTAVAQPAIVTASIAGMMALERLGVVADCAIGHSLGELTALHFAGALDADAIVELATLRGRIMSGLSAPAGAMASIGAGPDLVAELLRGSSSVIACYNAPRQTVVAGEQSAVAALVERCRASGLMASVLPVAHAFHSPLVADAVVPFAAALAGTRFGPLLRRVISTVTGEPLAHDVDLPALLGRQLTAPVQFAGAIARAVPAVDLFIEVGPGQVLSGLAAGLVPGWAIATDAGGPSLSGLWRAVGSAFALGAPIRAEALYADRFTRPFDPAREPRFLVNPCELAPVPGDAGVADPVVTTAHEAFAQVAAAAAPAEAVPAQALRAAAAEAPSGMLFIDVLALVQQRLAERTELPLAAVAENAHLLNDLHLNSISVGQFVAEAARHLGLPVPVAPQMYAHATVAEVAVALYDMMRTGGTATAGPVAAGVAGVEPWVRPFTVVLTEHPRPSARTVAGDGGWRVIAPPGQPFAALLAEAIAREGGTGVLVCLPAAPAADHLPLLLEGARAMLAQPSASRFVLVQHGGGAAAFARTLHLEHRDRVVCVVDVPVDHPQATDWVVAEAVSAVRYTEAHYDAGGVRREPLLRLLPAAIAEPSELPLGPADLLLVTGGGKGIGAECALALARRTATRLILLGRSHPAQDPELAANLARFTDAGVQFRYVPVDVTDRRALCSLLAEVQEELGLVTAVLHAAGTNTPRLVQDLAEADFGRTVAVKVGGLDNILTAVAPEQLRLLVTFGSVIARTGMRGEADYAVANEWLTSLTERWQADHPACRCLALEWSVWSGVGMGERLGRVDALERDGITAISPDQGIAAFLSLCAQRLPGVAVVVTGRVGETPALRRESGELPLLRFVEEPRVHYPGVELVVDVRLSADTDPYLAEHVLQGAPLLPAVVGLEAMAQVAVALLGTGQQPPVFTDVHFPRPVVVPAGGSLTIRLAALARGPGRVDVVLRSAETDFQVDHFRATCLFSDTARDVTPIPLAVAPRAATPIAIVPDLYSGLLFQRGRFQRITGVHALTATGAVAELRPADDTPLFHQYLPGALILGDPGPRDASLQVAQLCTPEAMVLPVGAERLRLYSPDRPVAAPWTVHARQIASGDETFVYDLDLLDAGGQLLERWESLTMKRVRGEQSRVPWSVPLLGPYVERSVRSLIPRLSVSVALVESAETDRQVRSSRAMRSLFGDEAAVWRRPDGKPEVSSGGTVSAAHAGDITLAVSGSGAVGCDLEVVAVRNAQLWQDLLGQVGVRLASVVAQEAGEDQHTAATRVWSAHECLRKLGMAGPLPLVVHAVADGWVLLTAGSFTVATLVAQLHGGQRLVVAVSGRADS